MTATRDVLSNFKFRASWGSIGNQIILLADGSPDNYPYIPEMAPGLTNWLVDGQRPTTLSTPPMVSSAFTWEKVYTLDFGVDFGFFDNRLNGTFDWYRRDTKGMLAPGMDLPWVVGVAAAKQNAANLKTYGWELELNWRDRIKISITVSDSIFMIRRVKLPSLTTRPICWAPIAKGRRLVKYGDM